MCACVHLCLHTCACTCVCARLLSSPWGQAPSASLSSTAGFRLRFLPGGSPLSGQRALTSSSCWRLTGASSPEQCPHWPRGDPGPPLSLPQGQPALSAPALDPGVGHRPEGARDAASAGPHLSEPRPHPTPLLPQASSASPPPTHADQGALSPGLPQRGASLLGDWGSPWLCMRAGVLSGGNTLGPESGSPLKWEPDHACVCMCTQCVSVCVYTRACTWVCSPRGAWCALLPSLAPGPRAEVTPHQPTLPASLSRTQSFQHLRGKQCRGGSPGNQPPQGPGTSACLGPARPLSSSRLRLWINLDF